MSKNSLVQVGVSNAKEVFEDLSRRMWDIPFDNSQYQNEKFIINDALTPERAYRAAALRLQDRLDALKHAHFTERKTAVKLKQLERKLEAEQDDLERELIQIEIEEIMSSKLSNDKLINDAIVEANQLYNYVYSCPEYTREDFEKGEQAHFEQRLLIELTGNNGAAKALGCMGVDMDKLSSGQLTYKNNNLLIGVKDDASV